MRGKSKNARFLVNSSGCGFERVSLLEGLATLAVEVDL